MDCDEKFLAADAIIDWKDASVIALARQLRGELSNSLDIARSCFTWVRDEIPHCMDFARDEVTCTASEVLRVGTGFCYAKSHLLCAFLRANGIPAGMCYQRLSLNDDGPPYCLHGLNAVCVPEFGWYRLDPRGNKPGVTAEFDPPRERLAFSLQHEGEYDLPGIWATPHPHVMTALQSHTSVAVLVNALPDDDGSSA